MKIARPTAERLFAIFDNLHFLVEENEKPNPFIIEDSGLFIWICPLVNRYFKLQVGTSERTVIEKHFLSF